MGNLESRKPLSVQLMAIEKRQKTKQNKQTNKTHQEEAGTLTQFKPCKSERRYEALKYLTPKM